VTEGKIMLWALADRFVDEVIELYRSREQAERALRAVLADEPDWTGMMEIVPVPFDPHWRPKGKPVRRPRCAEGP
jgi:hypothetical protein